LRRHKRRRHIVNGLHAQRVRPLEP
jgi:hypothetical protein